VVGDHQVGILIPVEVAHRDHVGGAGGEVGRAGEAAGAVAEQDRDRAVGCVGDRQVRVLVDVGVEVPDRHRVGEQAGGIAGRAGEAAGGAAEQHRDVAGGKVAGEPVGDGQVGVVVGVEVTGRDRDGAVAGSEGGRGGRGGEAYRRLGLGQHGAGSQDQDGKQGRGDEHSETDGSHVASMADGPEVAAGVVATDRRDEPCGSASVTAPQPSNRA
jgi:hypothetical protein